jgi:hypothetical protein
MKYGYKWVTGFGIFVLILCLGLIFVALTPTPARADVTDLQLPVGKVFDSQWNVGACTQSSGTCTVSGLISSQLYKPGTGFVSFTSGMTVRFSYNNGSMPGNPIQLELWNSNNTLNTVMIPYGRFIAFENGANEGRQYMFVDNTTWYGYYINLQASTSTTSSTWTHGGTATTAQYQALTQAMVTSPAPPALPTNNVAQTSGSSLYPYTRGTSNRGWFIQWYDCCNSGSWSQSNASWSQGGTGPGFYAWVTGYIRWPGAMNGVSKTIWFRTGWDDKHRLYINGTQVTNGDCCSYSYGSYTAKPGEILYVQFYTDNSGGGPTSFEIAWDPQGDGTYQVLGGESIGQEAGGGSSWYSSTETASQLNQKNSDRARVAALAQGNKLYITQSGSYAEVDVIQEGTTNYIQGRGGIGDAQLIGDYNTLRIRQGDGLGSGKNLIEFDVNGSANTITLQQGWNGTWPTVSKDGIESGGHFIDLKVTGNTNTITLKQANAGGVNSGHYNKTEVTGNTNTITVNQGFGQNTYHSFYATITGNSNNVNVNQAAAGGQYMDLVLAGSGHTVTATQTGNGSHKATISLTNAGGASTLNLTQQGSINQQYNITQACANLSGCSVTVTQGSP